MKLQESKTGFYYVGTKRANITKLVNIFQRGYASGNVEEAVADMTRPGFSEPEVICFEAALGFFSIRKWAALLSKQEGLSKIPLLIVSENKNGLERIYLPIARKIDDVLNLTNWAEKDLQTKIFLLKKNKERLQDLNKQESFRRRNEKMNGILKRTFDFFLSSLVLLFLSPVFLLIATALRMETKGSVLNSSKRVGRNYRIFNFFTFRTEDTRVGQFIRSTGLEELPMLINIVRGDVSLIDHQIPQPLHDVKHIAGEIMLKNHMESKDANDNYIMINLE